ncbi:undecaprenyl-diphosphatase [Gordoniibacillus kamchatkensis]|uniref:undecaprenyl-diphosphatase n=1 Tax=Gordoniibacillus kamchatkensis TaxID=1590651 RepID=UPI000AC9099A|nr:undecaprenyl-diphosphatase [Paenibacillus sp. VKM B-2647]
MLQLDYQLFQLINGLAGTASFLNPVMRFLAQDGEYMFYLGVIVYWFIRTESNRRMIVQAVTAACLALGVSGLIGDLFYRDRPFVAHKVFQLIPHAANASFPSDHAIGAFVIATTIWLFRKRDGRLWLVLAACVAVSRVWTGVHYPSDVVGGALIGIAVAAGVHQLFARSRFAQKGLYAGIGLYERLEHKIWPKRPETLTVTPPGVQK